jgi:ribosome-binding protein aMBF1 (putative translation factor)
LSENGDRPDLGAAVRAEIRRLRLERRAAERVVEYYDWRLAELHRQYPLRSRLGDRIRHARQQSGLSQAMLARIAGLDPSTISRVERSGRASTKTIITICEVLGVTTDWTIMDAFHAQD